jgi:hypothetical protein
MDSTDASGQTVILFGRRDMDQVTNVLEANFMFSSKMSVDFRLRHYWVSTPYLSYFLLQNDGGIAPVEFNQNHDINYNLFNIDFNYTWNFAPGSQLSIVWKNAVNSMTDILENNYFHDLRNTVNSPASNSFSIRMLYYLDAMYLKRKKS